MSEKRKRNDKVVSSWGISENLSVLPKESEAVPAEGQPGRLSVEQYPAPPAAGPVPERISIDVEAHKSRDSRAMLKHCGAAGPEDAERVRKIAAEITTWAEDWMVEQGSVEEILEREFAALRQQGIEAGVKAMFERSCDALCDYCRLDGPPHDGLNDSDQPIDGAARFTHLDGDGREVECQASAIRALDASAIVAKVKGEIK